ncbi:MAG: hypothetical protein ACXVQY_05095 [Actinomycetota bacterium]
MPSASITNESCVLPGHTSQLQKTDGLVTVDDHPRALVAIWVPGLNYRPCRSALTRGTAAQAQRIAQDIRAAPAFPKGRFSCPNDDASAVRLYFEYAGSARVEGVDVSLRGCLPISAAGRAARRVTLALIRDLLPIAPQPWHDRMRAFVGL